MNSKNKNQDIEVKGKSKFLKVLKERFGVCKESTQMCPTGAYYVNAVNDIVGVWNAAQNFGNINGVN